MSWYENHSWCSMVNHGPTLHCDKDCLNHTMFILGFIICILGFICPRFIVAIHRVYYSLGFIISISFIYIIHMVYNINFWVQYKSIGFTIMVNFSPTLHCDKYFLNMKINHSRMLHCYKDSVHLKINHGQRGPTSHCEKDCLNMKLNNGQPWLF